MSGKWIVVSIFFLCAVSFSYAADGSKLWDSEGVPITINGTSLGDFDMATDEDGGIFFAWEAGEGYEVVVQRVDYTGETGGTFPIPGPAWTSEVVLSSGIFGGNQSPDVISDNDGGAIIAWVEKISETPINTWVYKAQRVDGDGTLLWGSAVSLSSSYMDSATNQPKPVVVSDGGNGAFVAMQSGGSCHVVHITWAGYLSGGVDGVDLGFDLGDAASDGAGGVIAAGLDGLVVVADRVILDAGSVSAVWTSGGVTVGNTTSSSTAVHAAADGAGGAIVSWNTNTNVRIQRIDSSGSQLWTSGGLELVSSTAVGGVWTYGITSDVCSNGAEGAFAVWTDWRNEPSTGGNCDIYAQHVDADGNLVWVQYGVRINSLTTGSQRYPVICSDTTGGAIATWQDYWDLSYNIRACRVNASDGSLDWSAWVINDDNGTAGDAQLVPKILFANDGPAPEGAIIAWNDERAARANYCQKMEIDTDVPPLPPSDLEAHITSPQIHVTWKDHSTNESGFEIEYKRWYRYSTEPTSWTLLDTTEPDVTSYQVDNPTYNYYYKFRVRAFNDFGYSTYSNEDQVLIGLLLYWIRVNSPNGGEVYAVGANREITWSSGTGILSVRIDYSVDGGSHWISPPIAASTINDGSYTWTVPDTLSDNCILRISDASDGSPYDLSNEPFSIVPAGPDLVVESFSCDQQDTAVQDTDLDFHCTVRNVGSVASDTFWVNLFPDHDGPPQPGEFGYPYQLVSGGLAPGASHDCDFTYAYTAPGLVHAYVKVDTNDMIDEADEDNNIMGPLDFQVREFEFIEGTPGTSDWWFGGDNRDGWTRNVGYGQSFTLPRSGHVDYAGFHLKQRFDYYENPEGVGHAVTLILNIRADDGTIVRTVSENLPASFDGGWVFFDVNADLWAGETYLFTCYLQDGHVNNLTSYIRARNDDPWPDSQGYYRDNRTAPYDMEEWSTWYTHLWDFNFRIAGTYTDLSKADFTRNYMVDLEDGAELAARWMRDDCALPGWCDQTDLDYSSSVDVSDLDTWTSWWLWDGYGWLDRDKIVAMDADLSTANIYGSDGIEFWPGTYFIYKTSAGRYGKFIVEKWEPDVNHQLTLGWITYNADGTIYSTGTGLVIRGTFACDLDTGTETSTNADWSWVQISSSVRYLDPINAAEFKMMYRADEP